MKLSTAAKSCQKLTDLWGLKLSSPTRMKENGNCSVLVERLSPKKIKEIKAGEVKKVSNKLSPSKKVKAMNSSTTKLSFDKKKLQDMDNKDVVIIVEKINVKKAVSSPKVKSKENAGSPCRKTTLTPNKTCLKEVNRISPTLKENKDVLKLGKNGEFEAQKNGNKATNSLIKMLKSPNKKERSKSSTSAKTELFPESHPRNNEETNSLTCQVRLSQAYIPRKKLPPPTPIHCSITDEVFGDAVAIYTFVETFEQMLNIKRYFQRKITLHTVQKILFDTNLQGPLSSFLEMLIEAYYSFNDLQENSTMLPNAKPILWKEVKKIPCDAYIISEIVRSHLLLMLPKFKDDKFLQNATDLLKVFSVFELAPRERATVINATIESLLHLSEFQNLTSENQETIFKALKQLNFIRQRNVKKSSDASLMEQLTKWQIVKDLFLPAQQDTSNISDSLPKSSKTEPSPKEVAETVEVETNTTVQGQDQDVANSAVPVVNQQMMLMEKIKEIGIPVVLEQCENHLVKVLNKLRVSISFGYDRDYRKYWVIKSIPCILVEVDPTVENELMDLLPMPIEINLEDEGSGKENSPEKGNEENMEQEICKNDTSQRWFFYSEKESIDLLIQNLDNNLFQEVELKKRLTFETNFLQRLLLDSKDDDLWMNILADSTGKFGTRAQKKLQMLDRPQEAMEEMMIDSLIELDEKLRNGCMGGISCDIEEWYDTLRNRDYKKIIEQETNSTLPVNAVAAYSVALQKLKRTINRRYFQKHFYENRRSSSGHSTGWTKYVSGAENLSQLFLGLCLLERGIQWDMSLSHSRCKVCRRLGAGGMVLCDDCNCSFHIKCLGLEAIPMDKWCCENCAAEQEEEGEKDKNICSKCDRKYLVITCSRCSCKFHLQCAKCDYAKWPSVTKCAFCRSKVIVPSRSQLKSLELTRAQRASLRAAKNARRSSDWIGNSLRRRSSRNESSRTPTQRELPSFRSKGSETRRRSVAESEVESESDEMPIKRKRSSQRIRGSQEIQKMLDEENGNSQANAESCGIDIKTCEVVLRKLQTHECGQMFSSCNYKDIAKPMDLGTVQSNLRSMAYHTNEELVSDIQLIFDNFRNYKKKARYNERKAATTLEEVFHDLLTKYNIKRLSK